MKKVIFSIIFTVPGTPKDLLVYFAGLTDMKLSTWIIISAFGRIPSVITSTIGGSALGEGEYYSAIAALIITAVLSLAGFLVYKLVIKEKK